MANRARTIPRLYGTHDELDTCGTIVCSDSRAEAV